MLFIVDQSFLIFDQATPQISLDFENISLFLAPSFRINLKVMSNFLPPVVSNFKIFGIYFRGKLSSCLHHSYATICPSLPSAELSTGETAGKLGVVFFICKRYENSQFSFKLSRSLHQRDDLITFRRYHKFGRVYFSLKVYIIEIKWLVT